MQRPIPIPKIFSLLVLVVAIFGIWALFAFRNDIATYRLSGQVVNNFQEPRSTEVMVCSVAQPPANGEGCVRRYTSAEGRFQVEYNALENSKIYVFLRKEGYAPVREEINLTSHRDNRHISLANVSLPYLHPVRSADQKLGYAPEYQLRLFSDRCLQQERVVSAAHVYFFENVRVVNDALQHCQTGVAREVSLEHSAPIQIYQAEITFDIGRGVEKASFFFCEPNTYLPARAASPNQLTSKE